MNIKHEAWCYNISLQNWHNKSRVSLGKYTEMESHVLSVKELIKEGHLQISVLNG